MGFVNGFSPFLHKRKSFEHEKELSVLSGNREANQNICDLTNGGQRVNINLNTLIENIYVPPASPVWFTNLVSKILEKYELNFEVISSTLNETSIY